MPIGRVPVPVKSGDWVYVKVAGFLGGHVEKVGIGEIIVRVFDLVDAETRSIALPNPPRFGEWEP